MIRAQSAEERKIFMNLLFGILWYVFILAIVCTIVGWRYNMGPVIWARRSRGRARALEDDTSRRELVERVRQRLPQASDQNVVFSLQVESRTSGGSRMRVTTYTYYYKVFVADADCLWVLPFTYDKKTRGYELGDPVSLTHDLIQRVSLAGKRGRKLSVSFSLKPEVGLDKLVMVLEPLQFQRNKFYPFDFLQEEACARALDLTEKLALSGCGLTPEDLEETRVEDECGNYATAAGLCGFFGIIAASVGNTALLPLAFFAAALALFGVMIGKKQMPKISLVIVIVEAVIAFLLFR